MQAALRSPEWFVARPTQAAGKGKKGPAKYRGWFQDHEEADGGLCYRCPPSP
ncbi:uncharacterized protein RAG0_15402 [Rhynchosporium agropyri]|uniref:Uncharacterized protein n=1 Tax=Rhynchosporium agropyri TaxID=914238 RepID=A0A1E1LKX5_9HELO|nr:uncharacterized protein RAG0_15402 [Rhynchosporium agropyri]